MAVGSGPAGPVLAGRTNNFRERICYICYVILLLNINSKLSHQKIKFLN